MIYSSNIIEQLNQAIILHHLTESPMSALFQPFTLKDVTLRNRIAVPPMCQYSATDGLINEWHMANYTGMARGALGW